MRFHPLDFVGNLRWGGLCKAKSNLQNHVVGVFENAVAMGKVVLFGGKRFYNAIVQHLDGVDDILGALSKATGIANNHTANEIIIANATTTIAVIFLALPPKLKELPLVV